jgi:hypothetical protein
VSAAVRTLGLAALIALAAPAALAQSLATLSADFVRVTGHGRHVVLVSALDPTGEPLGGLEQAFTAQVDGNPVGQLLAQSTRARYSANTVFLVADGALFSRDALPALQDAVRAAAGSLRAGDRLRVIGAGRARHAKEGGRDDLGRLAGSLDALADTETPLLYDALYEAARAASHRSAGEGAAIVLITRGADGGSEHTLLEVLALARTRERLTPVMVVLVGDEGAAAESDRLQRLASHTAGAFVRVTSPIDLPGALPPVLERALSRWLLTFDAPGWSSSAPAHRLAITAEQNGERRETSLEYASADVQPTAWWLSPWVWIVPIALLLGGGGALFATRRRQLGLLVHDGGEEDGNWYEILALPATVGAAAGNDLVLDGETVSRNHAVLERRGRTVELTDLNSENGTLVNGERISRRALADGDRVSFGPDVHLVYEARG